MYVKVRINLENLLLSSSMFNVFILSKFIVKRYNYIYQCNISGFMKHTKKHDKNCLMKEGTLKVNVASKIRKIETNLLKRRDFDKGIRIWKACTNQGH